jgi:hypothetical protein
VLRSTKKSPNGCRLQVEGCGQFLIAESLASKDQQLSLAWFDTRQQEPDPQLLLTGREKFLGCRRSANEGDQTFIPALAHLVPQFVQAGLGRSPIQPALRMLTSGLSADRSPQAHLNGEFLRSRWVQDYFGDDTGQARIMGAKDPFDIQPGVVGICSNNGFTD